jgi:pimeloyl-ACP methyl ester carboxylesterase
MPTATGADGVLLHYELEGSGPPLLLHLGAGCDAELWRKAGYVDRLARHRTCILFDHRGHGASDHPTGPADNHINRYAADVVALLRQIGFESVDFLGWSNGGLIGLKVADDHPALIRRLVVMGMIVSDDSSEDWANVIPARVAVHRERGWEWLIEAFRDEEGPAPSWMEEWVRKTDIEPYIGWWQARGDWDWRAWDAIARVKTPTLFIVGELEDADDEVAAAVVRMANAERIRVPAKGHILAYLDSEFVGPIVERYLTDDSGPDK